MIVYQPSQVVPLSFCPTPANRMFVQVRNRAVVAVVVVVAVPIIVAVAVHVTVTMEL